MGLLCRWWTLQTTTGKDYRLFILVFYMLLRIIFGERDRI